MDKRIDKNEMDNHKVIMNVKVYNKDGLLFTNCKIGYKIGEGKKSYVFRCQMNLENPNNDILVYNNRKNSKLTNNIVIKFLKVPRYNYNKDYSYLATAKDFTSLIIYGITAIKCKDVEFIEKIKYDHYRCLLMNEVEGVMLKHFIDLLARNIFRYSFGEYLILYEKICNKINLMHDKFIFHNDLKSHNIVIDNFYNPSLLNVDIIDFGESVCYYNNKILSNYYIDDEINEYIKQSQSSFKINGVFYDRNEIVDIGNSKTLRQYVKYFKFIDKFNIFIDIFKTYYLSNSYEGKVDKINEIEELMQREFKIRSKKLLRFIFDYNIFTRMNYPILMLLLYKNHMINPTIVEHVKKLYWIIHHCKEDLNVLKDDRTKIDNLFKDYDGSLIRINHREILLMFCIYNSFILYNKKCDDINEEYFIKPGGLIDYVKSLYNKEIIDKALIITKYEICEYDFDERMKMVYDVKNEPLTMIMFRIIKFIDDIKVNDNGLKINMNDED